jgi:hypothetical protein
VHFTYGRFGDEDDIAQGDILQSTQELRRVFEEVHPHFLHEKYAGFLVLTQTCDLVRRDAGRCKSRYINLAVIRPLQQILRVLFERVCTPVKVAGRVVPGLFVRDERSKADQLLDRIFNQNEQALGLFYLHPDVGVRIPVPSVALLQVSIAVRAEEHYQTLVESRTGRLRPEFQSKLGWLIGNLFARVATEDMPSAQRKELKEQAFGLASDTNSPPDAVVRWIPRECVKEAQMRRIVVDESATVQKIASLLEGCRPPSPLETAIRQVVSVIETIVPDLLPEQTDRIKTRLTNDPLFQTAIKPSESPLP